MTVQIRPTRTLPRAAWFAVLSVFLIFFTVLSLHAQTASGPIDRVVAAHYPPLMTENSEPMPGMAVELLQIAANRIGRDVSVKFMPFQRALFALEQRSDTLMPALFKNDDRSSHYQWVAQIYAEQLRFLSTGHTINTLEAAKALDQIVVESGSSSARFLTENGFENLIFVSTPESSAQMLASDRVQAWFLTQDLAEAVWRDFDNDIELLVGEVIHRFPVYLVAGLDFPSDAAQAYADAIQSLHDDGTIATLLVKYFKSSS